MKQKISLGRYPYTYARVSVMKSKLIRSEEYARLIKMSLNEIISFLQASEYKEAIDQFGVKYSGVELMEMALNKNLTDAWNKLRRISPEEVVFLIDTYLDRTDLWNLKTIMRGLHAKATPEQIEVMLLPAGRLSLTGLRMLIKSESVEDFLKKLGIADIKFESMQKEFEVFKSKKLIFELENFLDRTYYGRMIEFTECIPKEGKLFKKFLEAEIETINAMNVLRLQRAGTSGSKVRSYVVGNASATIKKLIASGSRKESMQLMKIPEPAAGDFVSTGSLTGVEVEAYRRLLKKTGILLHQHPLSVDVILGYMFAKEIEVKNLKILLKSRQLKLDEKFTEQRLIM